MFFILSKILAFFLMPLVAIFILLTISYFLKRSITWKKRLFGIGLFLLFFFGNDFIANEVVLLWEIPATKFSDITEHEWVLLLTGVTKYEVGPTDRVYFNRGADRVIHTVQLYKLGKVKKILVTGGSGRLDAMDTKESVEVASALKLMGVPDSAIFLENNSRNTYESAVESRKIFDEKKVETTCLLVTSAFHMRRSLLCFEKAGVKVEPFSTDFISHNRKFRLDILLVPSSEAMIHWQTLIKEWVGIVAYKLAGYI